MIRVIDLNEASPLAVDAGMRSIFAIGRVTTWPLSPLLGTEELKINAVQFDAGARFRPHIHRYDQILYYVYGTGVVAIDGGDDILVPTGQYVMLPANTVQMHGCTEDGPAMHISMMRDTLTSFDVECPPTWIRYQKESA